MKTIMIKPVIWKPGIWKRYSKTDLRIESGKIFIKVLNEAFIDSWN